MHDTAMDFGARFFNAYTKGAQGLVIVDIGAQDVNGSLKSVSPANNKYIGVDFAKGSGVDIVIEDPYSLPFETNSVDVCVSSSCFEHSEFFWLLFNETLRVLKPTGLLYVNVPSNGSFHRYPVDCWRFYPDSGTALQNWGRRSGYNVVLLESFIGLQKNDSWNDFVAVFLKDEGHAKNYGNRILNSLDSYTNGHLYGQDQITNLIELSQDQDAHMKLKALIESFKGILNPPGR